MKAKIICTARNARIYLLSAAIVNFGYYSHSFYSYHVIVTEGGARKCTYDMNYFVTQIRPVTDTIMRSGAATVIILMCNIAIVWKLIQVNNLCLSIQMKGFILDTFKDGLILDRALFKGNGLHLCLSFGKLIYLLVTLMYNLE